MKIRNIVLAILLYLLFLNSSFAKNPSDFIQEITDNASKILSSDLSKNEKQNNHLWVMSSFMATYASIINLLKKYLLKNKIKNEDANKYLNIFLTGMLFEFNHHNFDLNKSIKSLQTRGGINEDLLKRLQKDKFFKKIEINLNKIFLRLKKANDK